MLLENALYRIEIESTHGCIVDVVDKAGGYSLIGEPRLAENFRLLLPQPGMQANYLLGAEQTLTTWTQQEDGLRLRWDGPLTNAQDTFDLSVAMDIAFVDAAIEFRCTVENRTTCSLAEVWYPILGGMTGLGPEETRAQTVVVVPHYYSQWVRQLFHTFGTGECLGVDGGEHRFNYPGNMSMPWVSLHHPQQQRGLFSMVADPTPRCKLLRFGFYPGTAHDRVDGDWPDAAEVDGAPVGLSLNWVMLPYTPPGETFTGPPVVVGAHAGGWQEAALQYRTWFAGSFGVRPPAADWLTEHTATLDTMFMLPEDTINLTFRDMPAWAQKAKDHGVSAVLVSGWQVGGHDRGYPCYEPEPRLGSWEELAEGIRACHQLGVRVMFFVNVQPVDVSTDWYRRELRQYRILDPWGDDYGHAGYGMGTLSARSGLTDVGMVSLSPGIPAVRELFVRQMRRLAEIGADGVHIDKFINPGLDFNPLLTGSSDTADWCGSLQVVEEMLAACHAVNPEFAFSYEGWFDRLMSYSGVMWWAPPEHSVMQVTFPEWRPHAGITQPYAFNTVNLAVLHGHHLLVGPRNYQSGMDFSPMQALNAYIGEVTRIRAGVVDTVLCGELLDASEPLFAREPPALRLGGAFACDPHARWSVFRDPQRDQCTAVLANLGRDPLDVVVESLHGADGRCMLYQPFAAVKEINLPHTFHIPSERVAFVSW